MDIFELTRTKHLTSSPPHTTQQAEEEEQVQSGFKVDVADSRFQALFQDAKYAVDPTDARFKDTQAMRDLMKERRQRTQKKIKVGWRYMSFVSQWA